MRGALSAWRSSGDAARQAPAQAAAAWRGLDPANPALWPVLPRRTLFAAVALAVALPAGLLLSAQAESGLQAAQAREAGLRQAFTAKLAQAAQMAPLLRRRQELRELCAEQERRFVPVRPDALLAALHQAALRRGLQVELIRPEPGLGREPSSEAPITLRLAGRYDALDAFAADVAALEPPLTLHDLQLTVAAREAGLVFEATARGMGRPDGPGTAAHVAQAASAPAGEAQARP
jgi:type IV pilus assembly protein PilO